MKLASVDSYRVVTLLGGGYRHLGAESWGGVTACGVKFRWPTAKSGGVTDSRRAMVERPGTIGVGCLRCQRSRSYAMAQVTLRQAGVTL